jgi:hypothetical protein
MEGLEKKIQKTYKIQKINLYLFFASLFFIFGASSTNATSFLFQPSSGSYTNGDSFSVSVYVSSKEQSMNAASGVVSFPADKLEVNSISKDGSIFSLWISDPSFSNTDGRVSFEGIVLNPGFTGSSGKIFTINFKAKAEGSAKVNFSSGSILANDGQGTDILTGMDSANFSITATEASPKSEEPVEIIKDEPVLPEVLPEVLPSGLLAEPRIISETHPNQNNWYAHNNPIFSWSLPSGATAVRTSYSENIEGTPTVNYVPPISSKTLENLEDGTYYFHARFKNNLGWGDIAHFKFQIDTSKPSLLKITEKEREDLTNPQVKFILEATDEESGIDFYEVKIDNYDSVVLNYEEKKFFETAILSQGKHILVVKAVDRAGNYLAEVAEFKIEPLATPVVTYYPKRLDIGEPLLIQGQGLPGTTAIITFQNQKGELREKRAKVDENGEFVLVFDGELNSDVYAFWVELQDERGAVSAQTDKLSFVIEPLIIIRIGKELNKFLVILIPLIAMLFVIVKVIYYVLNKSGRTKKTVRKDVRMAEKALNDFMNEPRAHLSKTVKEVEKLIRKGVLKEEKITLQSLKKELKTVEKGIDNELKKIGK